MWVCWRRAALVAVVALGFGLAGGADALPITLTPSATTVDLGEFFTVTVGISGLASPGDSLRAFTLKLGYDPARLDFFDAVFGAALGTPVCASGDPGPCGALTTEGAAGGVITLTNTSLLSDLSSQASAFTLAVVTFEALSPQANFVLTDIDLLTDPFTELVLTDNGAPQTLSLAPFDTPLPSLTITVIPEPGTAWLLASGVLVLATRRRG